MNLFYILPIAFVPALLWFIFGFFVQKRINYIEFAVSLTASFFLAWGLVGAGSYSLTADTEILNGVVTAKARNKVSCGHSYECNCSTTCSGSGKSRSCSKSCSTCYEHPWDIDWDVVSTVGAFNISRVDRRGLTQPPRWEAVKIGEPASVPHSYVNYIKAVPESVLNVGVGLSEEAKAQVPPYPEVYDYYRVNRVISSVGSIPVLGLNTIVSERLRTLGAKHQVDVAVVITDKSNAYGRVVQNAWLGGKKNAAVIVLGMNKESPKKIDWVYVFSWSKNKIFDVKLRDDIQEIGVYDELRIANAISDNIEKLFKRRSMKDYEYLKDQIEPPTWSVVLALLLGFLTNLVASAFINPQLYNTIARASRVLPIKRGYRY